ncbi:MAG: hypothetical protein JW384_02163 [Nitrosomonadaceae bacterium]|nr:hypothetical protein [Nitrosomonadaceae bacterium]
MSNKYDRHICQVLRISSFSLERYSWNYRAGVPNIYVVESWVKVHDTSAKWVQSCNGKRLCGALAGLPLAAYRARRSLFKEQEHSVQANEGTSN